MNYIKSALMAVVAIGALSTGAMAQGEGMQLHNGSVVVIMPDGRMHTRTMTDQAMLASMVAKATPIAAGQILVMSGGKLYLMADSKMADGRMMSDLLMSAN